MAIEETGDTVRKASDRFYEALEQLLNGDAEPMAAVWSHRDDVTTMHPIGGREVGWDVVSEPWKMVASLSEDGSVTRRDQLVRANGELAYELTTEAASVKLSGRPLEVELRATNVYRLEDDEWKIVHHHTDLSDEFIEVLEELDVGE